MSDRLFDKIRFSKPGCDWQIVLVNPHKEGEDLVADNFVLARANGLHFHSTLVEGHAKSKEQQDIEFWGPVSIEHGNGQKVGDVVLVFRRGPLGRWMVQVEEEDAYETETLIKKVIRAARSSLDNVIQAVKKTVVQVGMGYANPRRLGGNMIAQHYVESGWSPQLADKMMDVFDYIQTPDSLGQAVFLKALQHMPDKMAREIFNQIRKPQVTVD
jgi:hypothetical protein